VSAIAGLWRFGEEDGAAAACAQMLSALACYGPHGTAQWADGTLALGRALYRLLPEDAYDRQPLVGGADRFVLVGDLRLDNRDEIAAATGLSPADCASLCDAALLLAAFERFGESCLSRLVGDFAFALWDRGCRHLFLARDPLGQRPLFYHRSRRLFAFATMAKGLHALAEIPRAPDEERVAEFAALLPADGPQTFFKNVSRVAPGECLTVTADGIRSRRYWQPSRQPLRLRPAEYVEGLRHHFDQATRARLRGTGTNVGTHLSAGLDSSSVTATAARVSPAGGRVIAFTAVPREGYRPADETWRIENEGVHAAHTASLYSNIEHVLIGSRGRSPFAGLDRSFFLHEQPMLNICNSTWVDAINDAARARGLRVLLTGALGNFTISYSGVEWLSRMISTGRWIEWAGTAAALRRRREIGRKELLTSSLGPLMTAAMWRRAVLATRGTDLRLASYCALRADFAAKLDLAGRAKIRGHDLSFRPHADGFALRLLGLRMTDLGAWNKGVLAGWGIDQRDPTSDRRVVEFCLSVPPREFLRDGLRRSLARRAFADRLPAAVTMERRRGYQTADWHETLAPLREVVSEEVGHLENNELVGRIFDLPRLRRLVDDWPKSGWAQDRATRDAYRFVLLRSISAGHFLRRASTMNG
jgi:asparagine synthase (glutamine-hydrolysing)